MGYIRSFLKSIKKGVKTAVPRIVKGVKASVPNIVKGVKTVGNNLSTIGDVVRTGVSKLSNLVTGPPTPLTPGMFIVDRYGKGAAKAASKNLNTEFTRTAADVMRQF
jgi:phage-related protein